MRKVAVGTGGSMDNQLGISGAVAAELDQILARHGGAGAWGVSTGSYRTLQPAPYAQRIVPLVTAAMNSLMRLTEVERLPGVDAAKLMSGPPVTEGFFKPELTNRLLLLTGLLEPSLP